MSAAFKSRTRRFDPPERHAHHVGRKNERRRHSSTGSNCQFTFALGADSGRSHSGAMKNDGVPVEVSTSSDSCEASGKSRFEEGGGISHENDGVECSKIGQERKQNVWSEDRQKENINERLSLGSDASNSNGLEVQNGNESLEGNIFHPDCNECARLQSQLHMAVGEIENRASLALSTVEGPQNAGSFCCFPFTSPHLNFSPGISQEGDNTRRKRRKLEKSKPIFSPGTVKVGSSTSYNLQAQQQLKDYTHQASFAPILSIKLPVIGFQVKLEAKLSSRIGDFLAFLWLFLTGFGYIRAISIGHRRLGELSQLPGVQLHESYPASQIADIILKEVERSELRLSEKEKGASKFILRLLRSRAGGLCHFFLDSCRMVWKWLW